MQFELFGHHTTRWPVGWSRSTCYIFLPPDGHRPFMRSGYVYKPLCWRVPRQLGITFLFEFWDEVCHHGLVPDAAQRAEADHTSCPLRLTPEHFVFRTWSPVDGEDIDRSDLGVVDLTEDAKCVIHRPPVRASLNSSTSSTVASATSSRQGPRIRAWLIDSGCPLDLIDRSFTTHFKNFVRPGQLVTLATANGDTEASEVLPMFLKKLGEHIEPHVLDSTPNVLSLGRRCVLDGYTFHWEGYSVHPWLLAPASSENIFLNVQDFVPYLVTDQCDAQVGQVAAAGPAKPNIAQLIQQTFGKHGYRTAMQNPASASSSHPSSSGDSNSKALPHSGVSSPQVHLLAQRVPRHRPV